MSRAMLEIRDDLADALRVPPEEAEISYKMDETIAFTEVADGRSSRL